MKFLLHLLLLILLSALAGAAWVAHRPADLIPLEPSRENGKSRDLVDDLKQATIKGSAIIEVSEADLNRHLSKVLSANMQDSLGSSITFERLALDLEPDIAHVTLAWQVAGHRSTATVDIRITRQEKVFRIEVTSGAYGRLRVPRGLLRPLAPALHSLTQTLQEEIQAMFQMNQVRLAQDKLVLDPRFQ